MIGDRKVVLVDTNILLDYALPDRDTHLEARRLMERADDSDSIDLCCFGGDLKDFYYIYQQEQKKTIRQKLDELPEAGALAANELAWSFVDSLEAFFTIVPCDMRTVWMARKLKDICSDFEDCLLLAACELADADFLVTNDERLQKIAPTKATDAETILTLLQPFL